MTDLARQRVLVTGGGTGVGRALALAFAGAGAEVVVAGRREAPLAELAAAAPGIRAVPADVTDAASVKALFDAAGPCGIVIANAGAATSAPFARVTPEDWQAMMAVNLTGTFLTFREGLARIEGWGRLIAVASTAGLKGYSYVAHYCAAKHGVVGLTKVTALETAGQGITCNAICPGYVLTPIVEKQIPDQMKANNMTREEVLERVILERQPSREFATVEQIGGIACHTGRESCFYRVFENGAWKVVEPVLKDPHAIYAEHKHE